MLKTFATMGKECTNKFHNYSFGEMRAMSRLGIVPFTNSLDYTKTHFLNKPKTHISEETAELLALSALVVYTVVKQNKQKVDMCHFDWETSEV
jgi:hypothetical protein